MFTLYSIIQTDCLVYSNILIVFQKIVDEEITVESLKKMLGKLFGLLEIIVKAVDGIPLPSTAFWLFSNVTLL